MSLLMVEKLKKKQGNFMKYEIFLILTFYDDNIPIIIYVYVCLT